MSILTRLEGGPFDGAAARLPVKSPEEALAIRPCPYMEGRCEIGCSGFHARKHFEGRAQHPRAAIYLLIEFGPIATDDGPELEALYRWQELKLDDQFQRVCEALDLLGDVAALPSEREAA